MARHLRWVRGEVVGFSKETEGCVRDTKAEDDDQDCEDLGECQYVCRGFPFRYWTASQHYLQEWRKEVGKSLAFSLEKVKALKRMQAMRSEKQKSKTINSWYSLVVTHPTTNRPAHDLSMAERTGSPVFHVLWSIAQMIVKV
jgi:hypothetical protein